MTKLHIINKREPRLAFTAVSDPLQQHCLPAVRTAVSGGEEASPGVTLRLHRRDARIKVYKQRRTPKVTLKPQHAGMRAGARRW